MPKKLYEINITAYKYFYIEADSEDDALECDFVADEQSASFGGEFEWEHDTTSAKEVDEDEAKIIRQMRPKLIAQAE